MATTMKETGIRSWFARAGRGRRLIFIGLAVLVVLDVFMWLKLDSSSPSSVDSQQGPSVSKRFDPGKPITAAQLQSLQWAEIGEAVGAVGGQSVDVERVIGLSNHIISAPVKYLVALLLLAQNRPVESLAAFDSIDLEALPPEFLYAPFRLRQALQSEQPNPYLEALRVAVAQEQVPALTQARVRAYDGSLARALASYLQTDPANWSSVDVKSLKQVAKHEGLAADVARMVGGALASGRVKDNVVPQLEQLRAGPEAIDLASFRRKIQQEVAAGSPQGQLLVASAKELLGNRKMFLERKYSSLVVNYRDADATELPTETVLLVFLAANTLGEQLEAERWGQELVRRHGDDEVKSWVRQQLVFEE